MVVHVDAADRVHHLDEAFEVDDRRVAHVRTGQFLNGLDGERHATPGVGRVDLGHAVSRHVHPQVARERDQVDGLPVAADVRHHQHVRAALVAFAAGIGSHDQDVDGGLLAVLGGGGRGTLTLRQQGLALHVVHGVIGRLHVEAHDHRHRQQHEAKDAGRHPEGDAVPLAARLHVLGRVLLLGKQVLGVGAVG